MIAYDEKLDARITKIVVDRGATTLEEALWT